MQSNNEFNTELKKIIAGSIPCIHMNTLSISNRVLNTFKNYLLQCKEKNIYTIDELLIHMEDNNGKSEN
jgi:hypothetical protein